MYLKQCPRLRSAGNERSVNVHLHVFVIMFFFYLQNQINLYNESCNNETLMDTERLVCFLKQRI